MEEEGGGAEPSKFLLSHDDPERAVDPEMQARLEALLEAAGMLPMYYSITNSTKLVQWENSMCYSYMYIQYKLAC